MLHRCPSCGRRARNVPGLCAQHLLQGSASSSPVQPVPPPPAELSERGWRVTSELGRGAFGAVWGAVREVDGSPAAIKVAPASHPQALRQLENEAEVMGKVPPPHAPALFEAGALADGSRFLAMEQLQGVSLAEWLASTTGLPDAAPFTSLAGAMVDAVEAVHQRGFLHRDLKPENLFLLGKPPRVTVTLIDFGLAAPLSGAVERETAGLGTPEYLAPELLSDAPRSWDPRSDLYALGVLFYEVLTGRPPFWGSDADVRHGHANVRPPPISRDRPIPPGLEEVVLRCLAKEPSERFPDAAALRTALASVSVSATQAIGGAPPRAVTATPKRVIVERTVAVLFFEPCGSTGALESTVAKAGAQLGHLAVGRCAVVVTDVAGETPVHRSIRVAEQLLRRGLASRILIDLTRARVSRTGAGGERYLSADFQREDRYLGKEEAEGIVLTPAALQTVEESLRFEPFPAREGHLRLVREGSSTGSTSTRTTTVSPLIGRSPVLEELVGSARATWADHSPRLRIVLGQAGMGKSRLATEVGQQLGTKARTLTLRALQPLDGTPHETLRALFRTTLELPLNLTPGAGLALLRRALGDENVDWVHAAALVLDWLEPSSPEIQAFASAPGVLSALTARAAGEVLRRAASRGRPLCLLLDDAHFADRSLLEALRYATLPEAKVPLWVGLFARPELDGLVRGWALEPKQTLELSPLTTPEAMHLARQLLRPADAIPDRALQWLVDRTQGIPLLLVELVRGLKRDGLVRRTAAGNSWFLATDELERALEQPAWEWISARELRSLPEELASHARLAALLGPHFRVPELTGVLRELETAGLGAQFPLDAQVATRRLVRANVLVHRDGWVGFRIDGLRQAFLKTLAEPLRLQIHQAATRHYRARLLQREELGEVLPALARHSAECGLRAEAAELYATLAERARARHDYFEAEGLYTRCLAQLDSPEEATRLKILQGRGVMRHRIARYDDSLSDLKGARELAQRLKAPLAELEILFDASMALDWLDEWSESRRLALEAEQLAQRCPELPVLHRARLVQALGRSAARFAETERAISLLEQAVQWAEPLGDAGYEVQVSSLVQLGFLLPFVGRISEAEHALERVLGLAQSHRDDLHLGAAYSNRSCLWIALNDEQRFLADAKQTVEAARRSGNVNYERSANFNAGYFFYWRGQQDVAEPYVRRSIELSERFWRFGYRPDVSVLLARVLWAAGDPGGCAKLVEQIEEHQRRAAAEKKVECLLAPNDQLLLELAAFAVRGATDAQWSALLERAREVAQGQELIEVLEVRGLIAQKEGKTALAHAAWTEALAATERIPSVMTGRLRERLSAL